MSIISIRLPDDLLQEIDNRAHACHMQRTAYIRAAIEQMNKAMLSKEKRHKLMQASQKVRKESMKINEEFDRIERDIED